MTARDVLSYACFYARLTVPALAGLLARLAAVFGARGRRALDVVGLRISNPLFKPVFDPRQFLSVENFSRGQDISDFFTLMRRVGIHDDWFAGQRILDVGCGSGTFTLAVAARGAAWVDGIDIDEPRIPYARAEAKRQQITNAAFHLMSVYELAFPPASYDRIISHTVFEHLPDLPKALEAMSRMLKPGGEAFITHDSFRSRYGAHVGHFVRVPWPCLFFSEEGVIAFWEAERKRYFARHGLPPEAAQLDLLGGGLLSLNKLTMAEVERHVRKAPFEVVALAPYGEEKVLLAALPFLRKWPAVFEYLRGSLVMRLRKPALLEHKA